MSHIERGASGTDYLLNLPTNRVLGKTVVDAKDHPSKGWYALAISIGILVIAAGGLGMMGFRQFSDLHWTLEAALGGVMLIAYAAYKIHQLRLSDLRDEQSSSPVPTASDRQIVESIPLQPLTADPANRECTPVQVYGKNVWDGIGNIGEVPSLPGNIDDILNQPDPHEPNRRIGDTYILVLIPETLDDAPLTLEKLREHLNKTKVTCYVDRRVPNNCMTSTAGSLSYWALLRKDVIPQSSGESLNAQWGLAHVDGGRLPSMLDLAIGHFLYFLDSGQPAPLAALPESRVMSVRCEEMVNLEDNSFRIPTFAATQIVGVKDIQLHMQFGLIDAEPCLNVGACRVIQLTSRGIDN